MLCAKDPSSAGKVKGKKENKRPPRPGLIFSSGSALTGRRVSQFWTCVCAFSDCKTRQFSSSASTSKPSTGSSLSSKENGGNSGHSSSPRSLSGESLKDKYVELSFVSGPPFLAILFRKSYGIDFFRIWEGVSTRISSVSFRLSSVPTYLVSFFFPAR